MPKDTKKAAKPRVKKDKDAPKRGLSSYMLFSQAMRETVKAENPDVSFGTIGKILGQKWKELSEEDKAPYNQAAVKDKERYEGEKAEYEKSHPPAPKGRKAKAAPAEEASEDDEESD